MVNKSPLIACLLIIAALLIAACGARPPGYGAPAAETPTRPPYQLSLLDAQRTTADFLNAWKVDNYDTMYTLLALNSRDAISRKDFEEAYRSAERIMTLLPEGKSYTLTNAIQQGAAADVGYEMTFKTRIFGTFTDPARVLRMAGTPDGWRVAWTSSNVIAELTDGAVLEVEETQPNRANIYDRSGQVIADQNGVVIKATLLTRNYPTGKPEDCYSELARVTKVRTAQQMAELYGSFTGRDYAFEVGELSQDTFTAERANLERVCTLSYSNQPTRRYVAGGLAPHIVGYVGRIPAESVNDWIARGYPRDALVGLDGIERYWESTLAGRGEAKLVVRLRGTAVRVLARREAQPSQGVYLTIDRKLQEAVQTMFKDAFASAVWGRWADGASAIVMDVNTGEILAIASYPDFNVEAFNPYSSLKDAQSLIANWTKDPRKPTFSRATLGQLPPASVFKIVSIAAALESGKFTANSRYTCTGIWNGEPLGDRLRKDWIASTAAGRHGTITLKQALTGSCDTYFWNVGWTLNGVDPTLLAQYARQMGLGVPTGIKDVSEATGTLPDPELHLKIYGTKWRGSDALNAVIGQGDVTVTPLQVTRMIAAIANGGTLYQPMLVQKVGIIGEPSYIAKPIQNGDLSLKPETLKTIHDGMCEVVTNRTLGTANFVFKDFKGAVICGKTGTAQAGGPNDQPHAWFAAFAGKSADKPDIAVVVVVEHSNEGSVVAAPIVRRIVEQYYDLPITPWPDFWRGGMPNPGTGD